MANALFSSFTTHLNTEQLNRYNKKLELLGITDPYSAPQVLYYPLKSANLEKMPDVQYPDIVNYLIFNPSPYTGQTMKAYKSTDAYKYFQAGWVKEVMVWHLDQKHFFVLLAKVRDCFYIITLYFACQCYR